MDKAAIWSSVKSSRNIYDLQVSHVGAYENARILGILKPVQNYYHRKNGTKQRCELVRTLHA